MVITFPCKDDKRPAVSGWQTYKGDCKSDLIGVMIPTGVYVIDVDSYKGVTTEDIENVLGGDSIAWDSAALQKTGRGGTHYAFRVDVDLIQGSDLLGVKGFDSRVSGKGYICTGRGYEDLSVWGLIETLNDPGDLPTLPACAIEALSVKKLDAFEAVEDDELDDFESILSNQRLGLNSIEILAYLDSLSVEYAEEGDKWLRVGMALYHETGGSEEGYKLFDDFSLKCPEKYNAEKNRSRWNSFNKKGGKVITFKSVIKACDNNTKSLIVDTKTHMTLSDKLESAENIEDIEVVLQDESFIGLGSIVTELLLKAVQSKFKKLAGVAPSLSTLKKKVKEVGRSEKVGGFVSDYVFLTCVAEYMHKSTKRTMGPRAFNVKHNRDTPSNDDEVVSAEAYACNIIECAHDGMYAPMFSEFFNYDGVDYFNTYKPTLLKPVKMGTTDIVDRIKNHVAHLLPTEFEQQLLINYLAHNVQYPGKKIHWAMILQGVQGDGKSFFAEMMKFVLGGSNSRTVTIESLDEKFTSWAEGNCMVFIEELKLDNYKKYETLNKLKPYISNPTVSVRRMQRDVYECVNTTNYFGLTNFKDSLPIDNTDRRYCVLFSQWQDRVKLENFMANNPGYYQNLYRDMRNNTGEILDWLLDHKIPDSFFAMDRAPETSAKNYMINVAKSDDFVSVEDAIHQFQCHDINENVVNITKLQTLVSDSYEYDGFPTKGKLANILSNMGYHNIGRYKNQARKNQKIYCKDDSKVASDFANVAFDDVPF